MSNNHKNKIYSEFLRILKAGELHVVAGKSQNNELEQRKNELLKIVKSDEPHEMTGKPREKHKSLPHNDSDWWDDLNYEQQVAYLEAHKGSQFKITKHHESDDDINIDEQVKSKDDRGNATVHKNFNEAKTQNIKNTEFMLDEKSNEPYAKLKVIGLKGKQEVVRLDISDWKKIIDKRLSLDKDSVTGKISVQSEKFDDYIDESNRLKKLHDATPVDVKKVLWKSLLRTNDENCGIEHKPNELNKVDKFDLRRNKVVIIKRPEKSVGQKEQALKNNIVFSEKSFMDEGLETRVYTFTPKISIGSSNVPSVDIKMDFPDVNIAMTAQDISVLARLRANAQPKGRPFRKDELAKLSKGRLPTKDELEKISDDNTRMIESIAQFGTPTLAKSYLDDLVNANSDDRSNGENDVRDLCARQKGEKLAPNQKLSWNDIESVLARAAFLTEDITSDDIHQQKISWFDVNPSIFEKIRANKEQLKNQPDTIPQVPKHILLPKDYEYPHWDPGEIEAKRPIQKPERKPGEKFDTYVKRITKELYNRSLSHEPMSVEQRYVWFEKNIEIYKSYESYMAMMRELKLLGNRRYVADTGGNRYSVRMNINIPINVYPNNMVWTDRDAHKVLFSANGFKDVTTSKTNEHEWTIPGAYNDATIADHRGGFAENTGRAFPKQAGIDLAEEGDYPTNPVHFKMLEKIGFKDCMKKIWDEYNRRKNSKVDTLDKVVFPSHEELLAEISKEQRELRGDIGKQSRHSAKIAIEFLSHLDL